MIHVCWHEGTDSFANAYGRSGYSCCTILNQMFDTYDCAHWSTFQNLPKDIPGAVVIIQGGNERNRVEEINQDLATLGWSIVINIADEACDFPQHQLIRPPRSLRWYQYAQPGVTDADRFFIGGYTKDLPFFTARPPKDLDWFFAGQNTHERRRACTDQLSRLSGGLLLRTRGFMQGMPWSEYYAHMVRARVVPCPSGPATPDSFRLSEALECGCVPIVDRFTPRYEGGDYWKMVFKVPPPFPIIEDWAKLPQIMAETLVDWDSLSVATQRWWAEYKADFNTWLGEDLRCLSQ